jgi:hypothetical protein
MFRSVMTSVILMVESLYAKSHYVLYCYAECHSAGCHYAKSHYAESHCVPYCCAECHFAGCHFAKSRYAESQYVPFCNVVSLC